MAEGINSYVPRHAGFIDFHNRKERWACLVAHRRAGKTVACVAELVFSALFSSKQDGRYAYVAPQYNQAKDIAWLYIKRLTADIPNMVYNETELRADFPNGSRIRLYGADNPDRLRGIFLDGVILDEVADMRPRVWGEIIRPLLADREGWAVFIGTPKGHNFFYEIWKTANASDYWFATSIKASTSGLIKAEELEDAKKGMTHDQYEQEFECFKPDALVACADRVRPIADLREGDTVMTHTGRFRRIKKAWAKAYSGDMVKIHSYGSKDIVCTPEHPIYVCAPGKQLYSWKQAKDIQPGDWLVTPRMDVRTDKVIPEPLARVIAWYVCEGNVSGNSLTFSIGAHEPEFVADLQGSLQKCGYESKAATHNNVTLVTVNSVVLADFLVGQCGSLAHNKRLPMSLLRGNEAAVWEVLHNGDGCVHTPKGRGNARDVYSYTTVSEGLAQQVQLIGAALGYSGTYTTRPGYESSIMGREITARASFMTQMRKSSQFDRLSGKTRMAKNGALGLVRDVTIEHYEGPVHNIQVANDESYVVNARAVHNCSFEAAILGAYYGRELRLAESEGRICFVDYDETLPVFTAWDLGYHDDTAIWFYQVTHTEIHCIDYYEASGLSIEDYANVVTSKGYKYEKHWLPHDARAKTLASGGRSIIEQIAPLLGGVGKISIVPSLSVQDGIQAARMMLPRVWFDQEKCDIAIEKLKLYQREWDEDKKAFREKPRHDNTSHCADAFRMMAISWKENKKKEKESLQVFPVKSYNGKTISIPLNDLWEETTKRVERY